MTNPSLRTPFGEIELRPVRSELGVWVYVLLPELDELLGVPGFGLANPIHVRPRPSAVAAAIRPRGISLQ